MWWLSATGRPTGKFEFPCSVLLASAILLKKAKLISKFFQFYEAVGLIKHDFLYNGCSLLSCTLLFCLSYIFTLLQVLFSRVENHDKTIWTEWSAFTAFGPLIVIFCLKWIIYNNFYYTSFCNSWGFWCEMHIFCWCWYLLWEYNFFFVIFISYI